MSSTVKKTSFQNGVAAWMHTCFGPKITADKVERGDRLLEEVFELLQSGDYPRDRIAALEAYVFGRPKGEPFQEVGGVMVTLAAYCVAHDLDMAASGDTELARVWTKIEQIRAKQAAKPTGSALPVAQELRPDELYQAVVEVLDERCRQIVGEGWTPEHDDGHTNFELAGAAAAYACGARYGDNYRHEGLQQQVEHEKSEIRGLWPSSWDWSWFKPTSRRRDLVKAAALAIAEIARIDRAARRGEG